MAAILYLKWDFNKKDPIDYKVISVSETEKQKLIRRNEVSAQPKYIDIKDAFRYGLEVDVKSENKNEAKKAKVEEPVEANENPIAEDQTTDVEEPVVKPKKVILAKSEIK